MAVIVEPKYINGYQTTDGQVWTGYDGYDNALKHQAKIDLAMWFIDHREGLSNFELAERLLSAYHMRPQEAQRPVEPRTPAIDPPELVGLPNKSTDPSKSGLDDDDIPF